MVDEYNKRAADATLERVMDQHKIDHGKGDSRTDLQMAKDRITAIAKDTQKKIDASSRQNEMRRKYF